MVIFALGRGLMASKTKQEPTVLGSPGLLGRGTREGLASGCRASHPERVLFSRASPGRLFHLAQRKSRVLRTEAQKARAEKGSPSRVGSVLVSSSGLILGWW